MARRFLGTLVCAAMAVHGCGSDDANGIATQAEASSDDTATGSRGSSQTSIDDDTTDDSTAGASSTTDAACDPGVDVPESSGDAVCPPQATTAQRLEACLCEHMPEVLDPRARPLDARDLLYYVNRWYSIDPCFPYAPADDVLESVRAMYINAVDDLEPELETLCGTYESDLVDVPVGLTDDDDRLRQVAWSSPAPGSLNVTHDGLDVGFEGSVGFGPMFAAAEQEAGILLYVRSGFRDLQTQNALFAYYADLEGDPAVASVYSAWPAHSEHQLGTTADVGYIHEGEYINPFAPLEADLHWTDAFVWIRANAHRFGIVTTYQPDRVHVHQYKPEPWHLRFVGVDAANTMHACSLSTEELLAFRYGIPPLPVFINMDLVYDAQVEGGWTPQTCAD